LKTLSATVFIKEENPEQDIKFRHHKIKDWEIFKVDMAKDTIDRTK